MFDEMVTTGRQAGSETSANKSIPGRDVARAKPYSAATGVAAGSMLTGTPE